MLHHGHSSCIPDKSIDLGSPTRDIQDVSPTWLQDCCDCWGLRVCLHFIDLVVQLPTAPKLDWATAAQHCGLIERNIRFLKEKIRSLRHSPPFEQVPGIMVVRMVLHIVKFVNGFPRRGDVKHYSPGEFMTDRRLNVNDLQLRFGVCCQVAENVEPRNSLAPRTRAAISLGNSGNLLGGQMFFALDTGHSIT